MSLLRIKDGSPMSVGDIVGSVESVEGKVYNPASAINLTHKHSACDCECHYCRTFAQNSNVCYLMVLLSMVDELLCHCQGDVLFVRFFEGPASGIDRQGPPPSNPRERIQKNAEALIDIPIIMQTMKGAIQTAVAQNAKS